MREAKLKHSYKESWHVVAQAYQERFRTLPHPKIPALISASFDGFAFDPAEQELTWVAYGTVDLPLPGWIKRLSNCQTCIFKTTNTLNYKKRVLNIHITNNEFRNVAVVEETNCFRIHPENDQWCEYEQTARLNIRSILGMQTQIEGIIMRTYGENYEAGRSVDQEFISNLVNLGTLPRRGFLEDLAVSKLDPAQAAQVPFTHSSHHVRRNSVLGNVVDIPDGDKDNSTEIDTVQPTDTKHKINAGSAPKHITIID